MFGEGMTPTVSRGSSDADEARGGAELRGHHSGHAVDADPLDLDVLERSLDGGAEPLADPVRVAGDLEGLEPDRVGGADARVVVAVALPLQEERELRVGLQPLDADLSPAQLVAVGTEPVAGH